MQGNRPAAVLLPLAALLLVAFAALAAAAAAYSGRVNVTSHATEGARASAYLDSPALTLTRRMEDEVAPEMMTWAASLAGGGHISPFIANKPVCLPNGRCSKPGARYTGRGCQKIYQDRSCK